MRRWVLNDYFLLTAPATSLCRSQDSKHTIHVRWWLPQESKLRPTSGNPSSGGISQTQKPTLWLGNKTMFLPNFSKTILE